VLYLYDNQIEVIENLEFAQILQYLYLQNNLIKEIPPMPTMANLTKLFLDENEIQYVTGLDLCTKLEELHIANQRLPQFTALEFDPQCLDTFSRTLKVLEISGNGIRSLLPFTKLYRLRKLLCANNQIHDMIEIEDIVRLPELQEANFIGNPVCKTSRYRDNTIGASSDSLSFLDEVRIQRHQHIAIRGLQAHRRKLGLTMPTSSGNRRGTGGHGDDYDHDEGGGEGLGDDSGGHSNLDAYYLNTSGGGGSGGDIAQESSAYSAGGGGENSGGPESHVHSTVGGDFTDSPQKSIADGNGAGGSGGGEASGLHLETEDA
jgi:hypothetical protein